MSSDGAPGFVVGERWSYETRRGEEASTFVVGLIEESRSGQIVHIRVDDISIGPQPQVYLAHVPMLESALLRSRLELIDTEVAAGGGEFAEGVRYFRGAEGAEANDNDLRDLIQIVDEMLNGRR